MSPDKYTKGFLPSPEDNCNLQGHRNKPVRGKLAKLIQAAKRWGASDAVIMLSSGIVVDNSLANLCHADPPCENFGMSANCPPHVSGPSGFRVWQKDSEYSIVVRIDVPQVVMFSDERCEVMRLLHEVVAGVEKIAIEEGFINSKAFAGGCCKDIFCHEHVSCHVLSGGNCRNPQLARPSMSGFGINVTELMKSAGWPSKMLTGKYSAETESMTWIAGLILLR